MEKKCFDSKLVHYPVIEDDADLKDAKHYLGLLNYIIKNNIYENLKYYRIERAAFLEAIKIYEQDKKNQLKAKTNSEK